MWLIFFYLFVSTITFLVWGFDKYRAKTHQWRVPERWLFSLILLGGSFGALAGMVTFHHKTRKPSFKIVVGVSMLVHIFLLLSMQNQI